ncbi:hypothetical protein BpHYR1_035648 [Brachionus plicatilis]|uniref:Uncharacterized protein n=1 Tax=Brachionus plicatilis TaxID=10195 RepID=A0A3M7PT44_BRAPC|nr:hypothetical protein BpHYR1_035648 [Brachionus plicatilis]
MVSLSLELGRQKKIAGTAIHLSGSQSYDFLAVVKIGAKTAAEYLVKHRILIETALNVNPDFTLTFDQLCIIAKLTKI